ncbi:MAG: gephyrin-like molybdotransferase Glp [Anaerolineales bacterium]|jgi:molybdopterin molybdotransferase
MPEFLKLVSPSEALALLMHSLPEGVPENELVDTLHAAGRVTAEDIRASQSLPSFSRSSMDGFAVRASDTFGVSESLPGYLSIKGEVPMGEEPAFSIESGQAAIIHTGGMLPQNADAVVMLEQTERTRNDEIAVLRAVAPGENAILVGEDVQEGQIVVRCGTQIRSAEVGGCMALGITQLRVAIRPKIGILSSGDEVIPPDQVPGPGQVRDVNSYSLAALVTEAGGEPVLYGIVKDKLEFLKDRAAKVLSECQSMIITAGSSASARDMTAEAIASLGAPGVVVHGINIRPGKPTILAVCNDKAVIGLPGNPVSAMVIAGLFVVPLIKRLLGEKVPRPDKSCMARLTLNIPSQAGREDWIAVKLIPSTNQSDELDTWLADPIFAKSNLIFSLAAADGLVRIPADVTGLESGERVQVFLF